MMCSDVPIFIRSKYINNKFSPPHRLNSHSKTNTTWSNFSFFCSSMASICNNCNVFTWGRSTNMSCNVAVLKLCFSREHKITEKVGGDDDRKVLSILFLQDSISNHSPHCASLPWGHGHWGEVIFSYSRQKSNWCYHYKCSGSVQSSVVTTIRIWHCREFLAILSHNL